MTNIIRIRGAAFYAYHGALKEEQHIGGKFEADIDIYTDFKEAAEEDNLHKTINYHEVYQLITKTVNERKYNLIETIAYRIADSILSDFKNIFRVAVRIKKYSVPVGGMLDHVEVEVIKDYGE